MLLCLLWLKLPGFLRSLLVNKVFLSLSVLFSSSSRGWLGQNGRGLAVVCCVSSPVCSVAVNFGLLLAHPLISRGTATIRHGSRVGIESAAIKLAISRKLILYGPAVVGLSLTAAAAVYVPSLIQSARSCSGFWELLLLRLFIAC